MSVTAKGHELIPVSAYLGQLSLSPGGDLWVSVLVQQLAGAWPHPVEGDESLRGSDDSLEMISLQHCAEGGWVFTTGDGLQLYLGATIPTEGTESAHCHLGVAA